MDKRRIDLLKRLTEASGVSGFEQEVAHIISEEVKGISQISYDKLGSIICAQRGTSDAPRVMLPAHMDEIGFMVKHITDEGFIKFTSLGSWLHSQLPAQGVVLKTTKGDLTGVIGSRPPHTLSPEEKKKPMEAKDLYIDIGVRDRKEAEGLGVKIGDPIIPKTSFVQMAHPDYLLGKAWDDRAGCALFIEVLKACQTKKHPNTLIGVGTAQEEVGMRGAQTSVRKVNPDVAIICETSAAYDIPGGELPGHKALGKGPLITLYDYGMIPNLKLRDFVIAVAERQRIPYQLTIAEHIMTDGAHIHIHAEGVPSIYLGVPARYIHSHAGIIHRPDFDNTVRLITEVVLRLDEKKVRDLSR